MKEGATIGEGVAGWDDAEDVEDGVDSVFRSALMRWFVRIVSGISSRMEENVTS